MKKLSSLSLKSWLILGILIRLILMPITAHSDLWALDFSQYFFVKEKIFNIYDYLYHLPSDHSLVKNYGTNFFTYPPLSYFTLGFFRLILSPFYDPHFSQDVMNNFSRLYQISGVFRHVFLLKLPYLLFDLGVVFLLKELFEKKEDKKKIFMLWLFNPLSLYTSFMMGQFDIIPVFFVVLALYFLKKQKNNLSIISLG